MCEANICRICLRTETKLYKFDLYQLKSYYEEVLALKVKDSDGLPEYFCNECAILLHKFHKFKEKCYMGQKVLKEILWKGPITHETVHKIDRTSLNLITSLERQTKNKLFAFILPAEKEEVEDETQRLLKVEYRETNTIDEPFTENIEKIEIDNIEESFTDNDDCDPDYDPVDPKSMSKMTEKKDNKRLQKTRLKKGPSLFHSIVKFEKNKLTDENNWKVINLSEEEAVKAFHGKAEDEKYIKAKFKCRHCYKWFSKEDIYKRHLKMRHDESKGQFECRFCKMRFKWSCHMRTHVSQHFTKYECLRCHLVCSFTTAVLHEEYHSGEAKKCVYCNEEFRHLSTYYTHLRTHRSEFVCTLCGSSFVSQLGLRQHKRVKHCVFGTEIPDDEEVTTFCERCNIRFETGKAYREHLFHSTMHVEEAGDDLKSESAAPRKILGKRLQAKITSQLSSGNTEDKSEDCTSNRLGKMEKRKWRKGRCRRQKTKPTTCHQCGEHFPTQAACMKHHLVDHPRTSFFPPNERHICEICGASLAPGSVSAHQNTHTREKVHTCDTCGRQFNSSVSMKRHQVTHTGEKPFGCSLCDKKFTQSNSMKLHFRTFHLKQPYPKRNRRKVKQDDHPETKQSESSGDDTDDVAEPKEPAHKRSPGVEPGPGAQAKSAAQILGNDIHFLTGGFYRAE